MPSDFLSNLYVFILAGFVGFELIKRVSPLLHTPLMSLTNALDAIVVVAAIIIAGRHETRLSTILGADRRGRFLQQHGRRILHHRPHAAHVQDRQAQKTMSPVVTPTTHRRALHRRRRSVYSVDQVAQLARHRRGTACWPARSPRRWPSAPRSSIRKSSVQVDHHRADHRRGHRHSPRHGANDRRAAADRPEPRLRRSFGRDDRHRRILRRAFRTSRDSAWREIGLEVIIGSLTFTGSLIAAGKLQEILPQRPIVYKGQNIVSLSVLGAALLLAIALVVNPEHTVSFPDHGRGGADLRNSAGHADRRRGHAHGDLAVELLRRVFRRAAGIRAE